MGGLKNIIPTPSRKIPCEFFEAPHTVLPLNIKFKMYGGTFCTLVSFQELVLLHFNITNDNYIYAIIKCLKINSSGF